MGLYSFEEGLERGAHHETFFPFCSFVTEEACAGKRWCKGGAWPWGAPWWELWPGQAGAQMVVAQEKLELPHPKHLLGCSPGITVPAVPWKGCLVGSPVLLPACSLLLRGVLQQEGRAVGLSQCCIVTVSALPPGTALLGWDLWGLSGSTEAGNLPPTVGRMPGWAGSGLCC